ncbi:MAG: hypothetical protein AB1458_13580 [Bacteroidota bacterium]
MITLGWGFATGWTGTGLGSGFWTTGFTGCAFAFLGGCFLTGFFKTFFLTIVAFFFLGGFCFFTVFFLAGKARLAGLRACFFLAFFFGDLVFFGFFFCAFLAIG